MYQALDNEQPALYRPQWGSSMASNQVAANQGTANEVWTATQRHIVLASFLGWMLDAFDFFLVVFVLQRIAGDFGTDVKSVTYAIFLTLAMRPVAHSCSDASPIITDAGRR